MSQVLAIIQARFSSTRLPGKVLKSVLDKPLLQHLLERLAPSQLVDKIVVATSTQTSDDAIAALCQQLGVDCFRGDLNDVLSRFYHCHQQFNSAHIVRLTADCPLLTAELLDEAVASHLQQGADYTANCIERIYPDGFDIEVFTAKALQSAFALAQKPSEREHVTPYIREHFRCANVNKPASHPEWRLTVDNPEDWQIVSHLFTELAAAQPLFSFADICRYLEQHPKWLAVNAHIGLNEGYQTSLQLDKQQGFL